MTRPKYVPTRPTLVKNLRNGPAPGAVQAGALAFLLPGHAHQLDLADHRRLRRVVIGGAKEVVGDVAVGLALGHDVERLVKAEAGGAQRAVILDEIGKTSVWEKGCR